MFYVKVTTTLLSLLLVLEGGGWVGGGVKEMIPCECVDSNHSNHFCGGNWRCSAVSYIDCHSFNIVLPLTSNVIKIHYQLHLVLNQSYNQNYNSRYGGFVLWKVLRCGDLICMNSDLFDLLRFYQVYASISNLMKVVNIHRNKNPSSFSQNR